MARELLSINIEQDEVVCATCEYFHQHYVRWPGHSEDGYYATNSGHCARPRIKSRRPGDEACYKYNASREQRVEAQG